MKIQFIIDCDYYGYHDFFVDWELPIIPRKKECIVFHSPIFSKIDDKLRNSLWKIYSVDWRYDKINGIYPQFWIKGA